MTDRCAHGQTDDHNKRYLPASTGRLPGSFPNGAVNLFTCRLNDPSAFISPEVPDPDDIVSTS